MKDERTHQLLGSFGTRQELAEVCKYYTAEDKGYFRMDDLLWIGPNGTDNPPPGELPVPEELRKWIPDRYLPEEEE